MVTFFIFGRRGDACYALFGQGKPCPYNNLLKNHQICRTPLGKISGHSPKITLIPLQLK